jgi:hypothetical protein
MIAKRPPCLPAQRPKLRAEHGFRGPALEAE